LPCCSYFDFAVQPHCRSVVMPNNRCVALRHGGFGLATDHVGSRIAKGRPRFSDSQRARLARSRIDYRASSRARRPSCLSATKLLERCHLPCPLLEWAGRRATHAGACLGVVLDVRHPGYLRASADRHVADHASVCAHDDEVAQLRQSRSVGDLHGFVDLGSCIQQGSSSDVLLRDPLCVGVHIDLPPGNWTGVS